MFFGTPCIIFFRNAKIRSLIVPDGLQGREIKRIKEGKVHVGVYGSLMNGLKGVGMVDLEVKRRKGGVWI